MKCYIGFCTPTRTEIDFFLEGCRASHDALVDLFECVDIFLRRLWFHSRISPTRDMVEIIVKIMAEVLSILCIATKEMQQPRTSKLFIRDIHK